MSPSPKSEEGFPVDVISIGGLPGTGTTTIGDLLSKRTGFKRYNMGFIFREMAKERGITLNEFGELVARNLEIDREIDRRQLEMAREGGVILEGRVSGFVLHSEGVPSFKVWLTAPPGVRFMRIARREGIDLKEVIRMTLEREHGEAERYKINYDFDIRDLSFYDCVIYNHRSPPERVTELILKRFEDFNEKMRGVKGDERDQE